MLSKRCDPSSCELLKLKNDFGLIIKEDYEIGKESSLQIRERFEGIEPLYLIRSSDSCGCIRFRDVFICDSLENPGYLIESGLYRLELSYSPKFRTNLYEVVGVPGRSRLLIHQGNYIKDSKGCILVGVANSNGTLSYSTLTLQRLMRVIKECQISSIKIL